MQKRLLEETKIGEFLTVGAEMEDDEVGLFIASSDVSSSCAFNFDEWRNFVDAVNRANDAFESSD